MAAKRGVDLGTHRSIGDYVLKLHREHPDWELIDAFYVANTLHTNSYEDWLSPEYVTTGAQVIKDFVEKLKALL